MVFFNGGIGVIFCFWGVYKMLFYYYFLYIIEFNYINVYIYISKCSVLSMVFKFDCI